MQRFSKFQAVAFSWFAVFAAAACAQDFNLISNPGFEGGSMEPWMIGPTFGVDALEVGVSTVDSIEGIRSLSVDHLGFPRTTQIVLTQAVGQPHAVAPDTEYIFSINAKVESGAGQVILFAGFDANPELLQTRNWEVAGVTDWQKYQFKFRVPKGVSQLTIGCLFSGMTGRNWLDWAQLYEIDNLVLNGDFENGGYWQFNDGFISANQHYFGEQSLSIPGELEQFRSAVQYVDLGSNVNNPDQAMYTIAAHLKTEVLATSDYQPPVVDCNSDDFDEDLDPVYGSGAQIRITCFQSGKPLRTLCMPFFESHCSQFVERKCSFLVPQYTDSLAVELAVFDSQMTAWFDNVRLTSRARPTSRELTLQTRIAPDRTVGHEASAVEAPEPDTYVTVAGPLGADFEDAISAVADFESDDYGKLVWVPRGDYLVKRIIPSSRLHLKMHRQACLRRDPTGLDGFRGTLIRNDVLQQYNRVSDVIVEGGVYQRALEPPEPNNNNVGNIVALYGDRIVVRNFHIPEWSQLTKLETVNGTPVEIPNSDIAISFLGHDVFAYHNSVFGPAGNLGDGSGPGGPGFDGLHSFGGERAHFMGNHVYAGDDGIGLFTGTIPFRSSFCDEEPRRLFIYNRNIRDVEIFNNRLSSNWGRAVSCGLARPRSDDSDLTAIVENVRARNIVGRHGGQAESLSVVCNPRRPLPVYPGQVCPTAESVASDPELFPDREPQVRNILFSHMTLTVDLANPAVGLPVQQAIRVYSEDVGSFSNICFRDITVNTVCEGPCNWSEADRPKELLQVRRSGLLCEHFAIDPVSGQFVSTGFTQIGISHRNYQINIENCRFFDNTNSFIRGFYVESTEPQSNAADDVNDVASDNLFQPGLPVIWQEIPDGIHDPG